MTEPAELNFESVRNKAILKIVRDLERKNALQWKNFKILQSEHNILKRNYLNLIEAVSYTHLTLPTILLV